MPGDDAAADVISVGAGEVPVQDHDVVAVIAQPGQGVVAIEGEVHGHPVATQPGRDRSGQAFVVFCYQYPHRFSWSKRGIWPGRSEGFSAFRARLGPKIAVERHTEVTRVTWV